MPPTEKLIAMLSEQLQPVQPLRPPAVRAIGWIALASGLIAVLAWLRGLRADLEIQLGEPAYLIQVAGAWLTGAAATFAAFNVSLPDRPRGWFLLPLPFAVLWLSGFAFGCPGDWIAIPAGAPIARDSIRCLVTIVMASVPLGLALWIMLRRSRPLRPSGTAWMGALAVATFADTAHLLIHVVQASLLVLVVNLVPVAAIITIAGLMGRRPLAAR